MIKSVSLEIDGKKLDLSLLNEEYQNELGPKFSVLVGSNGTSKSRIIGALSYSIKNRIGKVSNLKKSDKDRYLPCEVTYLEKPDKLITVSSTPFDKFPPGGVDVDAKASQKIGTYTYLGLRSKSGAGLRKNKDRIFDILISAFSSDSTSSVVSAVVNCFHRLNFETKVRVEFEKGDGRDYFARRKESNTSKTFSQMISGTLNSTRKIIDDGYEMKLDVNGQNGRRGFLDLIVEEREGILRIRSILVTKKDAEVPYDLLQSSSGELFLLTYGLGLASFLRNNTVILIDEPENSLHPNWQIEYVDFLKQLTGAYLNCHFVIATHSPHIISGLTSPSSKVIALFKDRKGNIFDEEIPVSPGGWPVERILLEVFGVQTVRNMHFEKYIADLLRLIAHPIKTEKDKEKMSIIVKKLEGFAVDQEDPLFKLINDAKGAFQ